MVCSSFPADGLSKTRRPFAARSTEHGRHQDLDGRDPIEIVQPGLRQVQVNAKIGWTFAAAMRSFMRADPDVIMVGEMRDAETAKMGIEASLTGHIVLSTLHTNSAPERSCALDLGMDPFNFADALGVLSQRLLANRANCKTVHAERDRAGAVARSTVASPGTTPPNWCLGAADEGSRSTAPGCARCDRTGYKGRLGIYELSSRTRRSSAWADARPSARLKKAVAQSMRTQTDGIDGVIRGLTDLHQVHTVQTSGGDRWAWSNPYAWPRKPLLAQNVVATSQPLAAQAGLQMLAAGGNAVDAILATAITLSLVEPVSNGIGSDAYALVWDGRKLHGLNASGRSPAAWTPDYFRGKASMPSRGWDTVTVPGCVSAWVEMHGKFGKIGGEEAT
jgi:hypothetical protein